MKLSKKFPCNLWKLTCNGRGNFVRYQYPNNERIRDMAIAITQSDKLGTPIFVQAIGTYVEIWVRSPTGDSTDSHIYHIPCVNEIQAQNTVRIWKAVWDI